MPAATRTKKEQRQYRKVLRSFDTPDGRVNVGDEPDCTDWPNLQALINTRYLSSEYRTGTINRSVEG